MFDLIKKIFGGSKSDKDVKELQPLVDEINEVYKTLDRLSDDELKSKTEEFRKTIAKNNEEIQSELDELNRSLIEDSLGAQETFEAHEKREELEKELFDSTNATLDDILPEAFAVVKEVCRRLTERGHVYEYAGNTNKWAMVPYDVQLMGGIVIHQGRIAEMQTGEGKTLVSILPMYLNALPQKGLHLVTVNDYLARRDCEWMQPVFDFLGITVGALQAKMENTQRQEIYKRDITYGTNNEFGFDYLRDNMVTKSEHMVQRGHWFAIVDEIDSVLIDEARTPLIISGPVGQTNQKFNEINPRVVQMVNQQTKLVNNVLSEVQDFVGMKDKEKKEKLGVALLTAHRGLPKHKRLRKMLQDPDNAKLMQETELFYLQDQGRKMKEIDETLFYVIEEKNHQVDITQMGRDLLTKAGEDPDMYLLPDIAAEMSEIEGDGNLTLEEKQAKKDEINLRFSERSDVIHTLNQLLRAHSLYDRDIEYVVQEGKVQIVDEHTGRILDGRRYSDGLHQAIEAKEGVKVERDTQTFATITLQNYYRLYNKLAGMTGTAETEEAEFEKIYELDVVVIPTNRPIVRDDQNDFIYRTQREKYKAIIDKIIEYRDEGRAILVGTASVEVSEVLSKLLQRQKIKHTVLNAKQHAREADIVAQAGKPGAITIATNMAGRGTDIKLDPEVKAAGGLAIIGSERHDSRRIDRQLRGRAGRQGDPGSSRFYISMEDKLMRLFGGDRMSSIMQTIKIPEGEPIEHSMMNKTVERSQKKVEENNFSVRKRLLDYDDVMNKQRSVIYKRRAYALRGERLRGEIFDYLEEQIEVWYEHMQSEPEAWKEVANDIRTNLLLDLKLDKEKAADLTSADFEELVLSESKKFYDRKEEMLGTDFMRQLEKVAVLQTIDEKWKEHLRVMDNLKEGIHLRSYGQKDPLLEYKKEAFELFGDLVQDINKQTISFAFRFFPQMAVRNEDGKSVPTGNAQPPAVPEGQKGTINSSETNGKPQPRRRPVMPSMQSSNSTSPMTFSRPQTSFEGEAPQQREPEGDQSSTLSKTVVREKPKIGRNDIVTLVYSDGKQMEGKYKKFQVDIEEGRAEIVES
ncbi:MAG: preprotein translocase subunit SecA [Candidatus Kapaibacteriales bacterium]